MLFLCSKLLYFGVLFFLSLQLRRLLFFVIHFLQGLDLIRLIHSALWKKKMMVNTLFLSPIRPPTHSITRNIPEEKKAQQTTTQTERQRRSPILLPSPSSNQKCVLWRGSFGSKPQKEKRRRFPKKGTEFFLSLPPKSSLCKDSETNQVSFPLFFPQNLFCFCGREPEKPKREKRDVPRSTNFHKNKESKRKKSATKKKNCSKN